MAIAVGEGGAVRAPAARDGKYQRLEPRFVRKTVERLHLRTATRIATRFPTGHLGDVALELAHLIDQVELSAATTRRRKRTTRTLANIGILPVAGTLVALVLAVRDAFTSGGEMRAFEWLPLVESTISDVVFIGFAVVFPVTLPTRHERALLLSMLHRRRSLAHVVDMHQLTKAPSG
jgi:hypothetical protein